MVTKNRKTGKSDFTPAEASDSGRKRRRIYFDLDESMAKGRKFLDKETDKKTGKLSQRAKNLQEAIKSARKDGSIADLGVIDIADDLKTLKAGGLVDATAKLKAKGMKEGGMVVKNKTVAIDTSPNSGLITTKGFGAGRKT
jgi:hypothetical protein